MRDILIEEIIKAKEEYADREMQVSNSLPSKAYYAGQRDAFRFMMDILKFSKEEIEDSGSNGYLSKVLEDIKQNIERTCFQSVFESLKITKLAIIIMPRTRVSYVSIVVSVHRIKKISFVSPHNLCIKQSFCL